MTTDSQIPNKSIYEQLGGEAGVLKLVQAFYCWMDTLPSARTIRQMHPPDLASSEEKLFLFLSGWTGGPSLYIQKHGHPMLRRRHFPFLIGEIERDQWMLCMYGALRECGVTDPLLALLSDSFYKLADHMINQEA